MRARWRRAGPQRLTRSLRRARRDLYENFLNGTIPDSLGSLTSLTNLCVCAVAALGCRWAARLTPPPPRIFFSRLNSNSLDGSIPSSLGNLTILNTLDLSSNFLTGTVPDTLGSLMQLAWALFRIDGNLLSGTIPAWFGNYSGPQLGLSNNQFSGSIPASLAVFPFDVKYIVCDTLVNASCTYYPGTGKYFYIPVQPTVVNVPGAFLTSCPAGTYRSGADTAVNGTLYFPAPVCSPCAFGTVATQPNTPICTPCSAGYAPSANASVCIPCPAGTFLDAASQSCQSCGVGTTSGASAIACTSCPPGYFSNIYNTECYACPAGTFLNATSHSCQSCPAGSSAPTAGSTTCTVNPSGFISVTKTSVSSSISLAGVSSFGPAENATLLSSLASLLNVSAAAIQVESASAAARRLAAAALTVQFSVVTTADSASIIGALNNTATFSASLVSSLQHMANTSLAGVTSAVVAPPSVQSVQLPAQPCSAGTFLNASSQRCQACAPGTYSANSGASFCKQCDAGTVWVNASACVSCPPNSITAPYNPAACACTVGFYDTKYGVAPSTPACAACPLIGAVCTTGLVGAKEGFWRENTLSDVFFKCREGVCLEEDVVGPLSQPNSNTSSATAFRRHLLQANTSNATISTNCVVGNTGPMCGLCVPGYALQSGQCLPCDPKDAFDNWSAGSKAVLLVLCIAASLVLVAFAFFQPIVPVLERASGAFTASLTAAWGRIVDCCCCCFQRSKRSDTAPVQGNAQDTGNPPHSQDDEEAAHAHALRQKTALEDARQGAVERQLSTSLASGIGMAAAVGMEMDDEEMEEGAADAMLGVFDGLEELLEQAQRVSKILIKCAPSPTAPAVSTSRRSDRPHSFYQIISTFIKSLDIPWPSAFTVVMSKVNVVNLNLVQLPAAACLNPSPSYYKQFNGACQQCIASTGCGGFG